EDVADQHVSLLRRVRLREYPFPATAVARHLHEPGQERAERLLEGLPAGWRRFVAVDVPLFKDCRPTTARWCSGYEAFQCSTSRLCSFMSCRRHGRRATASCAETRRRQAR